MSSTETLYRNNMQCIVEIACDGIVRSAQLKMDEGIHALIMGDRKQAAKKFRKARKEWMYIYGKLIPYPSDFSQMVRNICETLSKWINDAENN